VIQEKIHRQTREKIHIQIEEEIYTGRYRRRDSQADTG
jgi:hypothetical protein